MQGSLSSLKNNTAVAASGFCAILRPLASSLCMHILHGCSWQRPAVGLPLHHMLFVLVTLLDGLCGLLYATPLPALLQVAS